jgi:hypothetical protein
MRRLRWWLQPFEPIRTQRKPFNAPNRRFQRAQQALPLVLIGPGQVVFEFGPGEVVDRQAQLLRILLDRGNQVGKKQRELDLLGVR